MLSEFLSYKYKGIKTTKEILRSPKNLGWKCRKYIKWHDVHNTSGDRKNLWRFAKSLIDDNKIDQKLIGSINEILLNVQKWRVDPQNFSKEPDKRPQWEDTNRQIELSVVEHGLIALELVNQGHMLDDHSAFDIICSYYLLKISQFLETFGWIIRDDTNFFHLLKTDSEAIKKIFKPIYQEVGCCLPTHLEIDLFLQQIYLDFGFLPIDIKKISISFDSTKIKKEKKTKFIYKKSEASNLFKWHQYHEYTLIEVNKEHPFIMQLLEDNNLIKYFEYFFSAYVKAVEKMPRHEEVIYDLNSYLGLELKNPKLKNYL